MLRRRLAERKAKQCVERALHAPLNQLPPRILLGLGTLRIGEPLFFQALHGRALAFQHLLHASRQMAEGWPSAGCVRRRGGSESALYSPRVVCTFGPGW